MDDLLIMIPWSSRDTSLTWEPFKLHSLFFSDHKGCLVQLPEPWIYFFVEEIKIQSTSYTHDSLMGQLAACTAYSEKWLCWDLTRKFSSTLQNAHFTCSQVWTCLTSELYPEKFNKCWILCSSQKLVMIMRIIFWWWKTSCFGNLCLLIYTELLWLWP